MANWGLPLAALGDLKKDPEIISGNMTAGQFGGFHIVGNVGYIIFCLANCSCCACRLPSPYVLSVVYYALCVFIMLSAFGHSSH